MNQEDSEQNEVIDGMKKGADSTVSGGLEKVRRSEC